MQISYILYSFTNQRYYLLFLLDYMPIVVPIEREKAAEILAYQDRWKCVECAEDIRYVFIS